jgi:hypothetical protein
VCFSHDLQRSLRAGEFGGELFVLAPKPLVLGVGRVAWRTAGLLLRN